jgi:heat shock protein HslJ
MQNTRMKSFYMTQFAAALAASIASIAAVQPAWTPVGRYIATLPAGDSPRRALLLILTAEHTARLTTDDKNGKPPITDSGSWKTAEDHVVVSLTRRGTKALPTPRVLTFTASGDTLTAVDPNPKEWGSTGLTLTRDLAGGLIGGTWHMTKAVHGNDPPVVPKDPSKYTAQFGEDGTLSLLADCNRGRASYSADPPQLHVGPAAITRMMCPPGSLDTIFLRDLSAAATFDIDDGELHVTTKDGLATLTFERVR